MEFVVYYYDPYGDSHLFTCPAISPQAACDRVREECPGADILGVYIPTHPWH